MTTNQKLKRNILLSISFIEGGSLMAAELISAKLLAPYFGSSLFVWSTVLATTLGGLAIGYFTGGVLSKKPRKDLILLLTVIYSAVALMTMPFIAQFIASQGYTGSFNRSVLIAAIYTILPPVIGMGMVSPLVIANLTESKEESGKVSGTVYAISTVGGILFTFIFGFYIIPEFGLIIPAILTGLLLGLLPAIYLFKYGFKHQNIFLGVFILTLGLSYWQKKLIGQNFDVLYAKEGMLGQVVVADVNIMLDDYTLTKQRALFINMTIQSSAGQVDSLKFEHEYITHCKNIFNNLPVNANVLILGLGGGALPKLAVNAGLNTDVVEIDSRVIEVANLYFNLDKRVNTYCEDARWFIKHAEKQYDAIFIDVFKGEDAPAHVFTIEAVDEIDRILNTEGILVINSHGYYKGKIGKGNRSILKTLYSYGYDADFMHTHANEMRGNGLIFAGKQKNLYQDLIAEETLNKFLSKSEIDFEDALILTDKRPILDFLNMRANKEWRVNHLGYLNRVIKSKYIPLFQ